MLLFRKLLHTVHHLILPFLQGLLLTLSPVQGAVDETPLHQNDPCRAVMLDGRAPSYLDTNIHYTAGNCQQLTRGVVLAWSLEEERVRFEIHAPTSGWVSVGINTRASMLGADVAVGWVNDNGVGFLFDAKNDDQVKQVPLVDNSQDTVLLKAHEKNSVTSLYFSRPLLSDDMQDMDIKGRVWVVWAFGGEDPEDDKMEYLGFHVREGATSIRFFEDEDKDKSATPMQGKQEL